MKCVLTKNLACRIGRAKMTWYARIFARIVPHSSCPRCIPLRGLFASSYSSLRSLWPARPAREFGFSMKIAIVRQTSVCRKLGKEPSPENQLSWFPNVRQTSSVCRRSRKEPTNQGCLQLPKPSFVTLIDKLKFVGHLRTVSQALAIHYGNSSNAIGASLLVLPHLIEVWSCATTN